MIAAGIDVWRLQMTLPDGRREQPGGPYFSSLKETKAYCRQVSQSLELWELLLSVGLKYLISIPKLQRYHRWSLGMDK